MSPSFEAFEDRKEFLVVRVVVQLRAGQGAGVEGDRVEFTGLSGEGEDAGDGVVRGVGLDGEGSIGHPVV